MSVKSPINYSDTKQQFLSEIINAQNVRMQQNVSNTVGDEENPYRQSSFGPGDSP